MARQAFSVGNHVQFKFRSGTRAGFIRKVYSHPADAEEEGVAVGKAALSHASKDKPAYLIEIEKNGSYYVKTSDQLSLVQGEAGMSERQINKKDRGIKKEKVSGKRKAMDAEPKSNLASKKKTMRQTKRPRAK